VSIPHEAPPDRYAPRPIDLPTVVPLEPGADLGVLDEAKILAAPQDPALRPQWREALRRWRQEARGRVSYDGSLYEQQQGAWAANAWNVAMVWLWDEAVRDWDQHRFDADRLLATYADVGGLDAVVLWHAYPVIGIDPRSQFDWYDVPGLADLVDDLHTCGVKVFLDYNPWDVGTERTERSDAERLAGLIGSLGADGVFLDTLKEADPDLLTTMAGLRPRPVLEGESRVPLARIADHQASWAQWFADSQTPGVLRARWLERRHMVHHTRRWNRDHREELVSAWVNGAGVLLWDVVFGVRVDWQARDRAALHAMRRVYRHLGDFVLTGDWEPLTELAPAATAAGVSGSRWRLGGCDLFTLANSTGAAYHGPLLDVDSGKTSVVLGDGGVPAYGIGGILHCPDGAIPPIGLEMLVAANQADLGAPTERPRPVPQRLIPEPVHGPVPVAAVHVKPGQRELAVRYRQRETGLYEHAPYVEDWKPLPPRLHQIQETTRTVQLGRVAVDRTEVTNSEFEQFLAKSGYQPPDADRFLQHWGQGRPVPGTEHQPVSYVDLDDARAYARWRRARLPTEDEWQGAAQDPALRRGEPLVWQWTESEHRDGRTRWVILKGGSWFAAQGSDWYLDGGPQPPSWSVRFLLTQAGTGRSACIGFRCAVDVALAPGGSR